MKKILHSLCFTSCFFACLTITQAQEYCFRLASGKGLPKDSNTRALLLSSLDGFLQQKEQPNSRNSYVWPPELPATSVLLDEMKGIDHDDSAKEKDFFKAWLSNSTLLKDSTYLLQLSYNALKNGVPVHKAAFRLLARRQGNKYFFYAPLKRHTSGWKSRKERNVTFYFKDTIQWAKASSYARYNDLYQEKLGRKGQQTWLYCCDDFQEALQLSGVDYKAAYTGIRANSLSAFERDTCLVINGSFAATPGGFDPHDMWHEKLRTVLRAEQINRPVDEGCAYLYGGSWGLSWDEIKTLFKAYARSHPAADWQQLYTEGTDFEEGQEPLKVAYFINALLVQKLEKEKGFQAVMTLLACGKKEKGDKNYFAALEKLTGINAARFNTDVSALIAAL